MLHRKLSVVTPSEPFAVPETPVGRRISPRGRFLLEATVFFNGASVMCFELLMSRVAAPYFGSNVYSWGNLIGVILLGLAAGYYWGGQLVDRALDIRWPACFLMVAGLWVTLQPVMAQPVNSWIRHLPLPYPVLSFLSSWTLCFVPTVLLGTLLPFATRYYVDRLENVGSLSGKLGAVSTIGSLMGTFLTTFVIMSLDFLGTKRSLQLLGCLIILSAFGLVRALPVLQTRRRRPVLLSVGLLALCLAAGITIRYWKEPLPRLGYEGKLLDERDSAYSSIRVIEVPWWGGPESPIARVMNFGGEEGFQSAILLNGREDPTLLHYQNYFFLAWIFKENIKNIAMIGGGGGIVARNILRFFNDADVRFTCVEVDASVTKLATQYFGYPINDPRLKTVNTDGRVFLQAVSEPLDLVILDAYSSGARVPEHLITREFFEEVAQKMSAGGVLAVNLYGLTENHGTSLGEKERGANYYYAVLKTLSAVFGKSSVSVFAAERLTGKTSGPVSHQPNNILLFATKGNSPRLSVAASRVSKFAEPVWGLTVRHYLGTALPYPTDADVDPSVPLLTDDFNPINLIVKSSY
jgi:spermidine synthase